MEVNYKSARRNISIYLRTLPRPSRYFSLDTILQLSEQLTTRVITKSTNGRILPTDTVGHERGRRRNRSPVDDLTYRMHKHNIRDQPVRDDGSDVDTLAARSNTSNLTFDSNPGETINYLQSTSKLRQRIRRETAVWVQESSALSCREDSDCSCVVASPRAKTSVVISVDAKTSIDAPF